jgi:hypothetical protein
LESRSYAEISCGTAASRRGCTGDTENRRGWTGDTESSRGWTGDTENRRARKKIQRAAEDKQLAGEAEQEICKAGEAKQ